MNWVSFREIDGCATILYATSNMEGYSIMLDKYDKENHEIKNQAASCFEGAVSGDVV